MVLLGGHDSKREEEGRKEARRGRTGEKEDERGMAHAACGPRACTPLPVLHGAFLPRSYLHEHYSLRALLYSLNFSSVLLLLTGKTS